MKIVTLLFTLFLFVSCKDSIPNVEVAAASVNLGTEVNLPTPETTNPPAVAKVSNTKTQAVYAAEDYTLKFSMNPMDNNAYELLIDVELKNNAYYVSPNAKRDFKGKFTLELKEDNKLHSNSKLLETPPSVEEIDMHPYVNGTINWVRKNTNYRITLERNWEEDFHILGHVKFTIEPKCTLEIIPIILKFENGEMKVEIFDC
ncbi:MAG: hypothetical protein BM564_12415 [Bacteroidetes bacterium MedPE-SWsnd-G2]|nr:MAG: hypothetical protein BM564_12415 [Bacteroidetes bacterium MedPE-SWsnd-G2]